MCLHALFNLQKKFSEGSEKSTNLLNPDGIKLFGPELARLAPTDRLAENKSPNSNTSELSGCSSRSTSPPYKQLIFSHRVHDDLIPPSVRAIHRVHSCSVLKTEKSEDFHIELFSSPEKSDKVQTQLFSPIF